MFLNSLLCELCLLPGCGGSENKLRFEKLFKPAPQNSHFSREDSLTINLCSIFSLRTSTLPVVTNS